MYLAVRWTLFGFLMLLAPAVRADGTEAQKPPADIGDMDIKDLMELEVPVVTGASKLEQKTTEAPASVTIVGADEIKKYGHRTLGDVLRSVQGFNVSYDRNYDFLGARGVSLGDFNSRVLLLVDGHRVNNNLTDGAFIDTAFILDIDLVDRVEIIRGPGSVLYGNNAFFGVINVITRQGRQLNGLEASGEYGAFDTYKARATYGKQFTNGVEFLVSGTYYRSEGQDSLFFKEFNTPAQNNGVAQGLDDDTSKSAFGSLRYQDFSLESAFNTREKGNPTAQFLTTFNDPRLRTTDNRSYAALKFAHNFPDVVDVTAQVYYDRYKHEIGYPQSAAGISLFSSEQDVGEWWGTELELTKRLWDRHVITLGAEYRNDFHQEQDNSGQPPIMLDRESYGVYAQGDFEVLTNLHFNGGIRYDQYGHFAPAFNPRLALIYNPIETAAIKAIYGTAFRTPNFSELSDFRFQDIKPEKITTYELVYEQEIGPHLRSSIDGFYNQMGNLIVFDNGSFTNLDAETKGVELALEAALPGGMRGRGSYSFQYTRDKSLGWNVPDSPNHMVKLNLSVPVWREKVFADLEFQYTSDRQSLLSTNNGIGQPLTIQGGTAGGFAVVNFTIFTRELVKNLEVSASIYNILDAQYGDPASRFHVQDIIPQDGRSFRVKATYRF
ncbi:MAG: outer rane receptor for ferrienterochelin and colicin [Pedosphaera sp.]|nr:outer rane receptor for ferrienterochelin and colicin [Pedosphaera sp.]